MSELVVKIDGLEEIAALTKTVQDLKASFEMLNVRAFLTKEWYSREECAKLKNGPGMSWLNKNTHHYPNLGRAHRLCGGKWGFHWTEVAAWLPKTYDEIEKEYQKARLEGRYVS